MNIGDITIDLDSYMLNHHLESGNVDQRFIELQKNIAAGFNRCRVGDQYQNIRKKLPSEELHVFVKYKGENRLVVSGKWADFHESLIQETAQKCFRHVDLNFNIVVGAFDFIRRIPAAEWPALADQINKCSPITSKELRAFKQGSWSHEIFQRTDWPVLALKEFLIGNISTDQISALFLYDACLQHYPETARTFQLLDDKGVINQEALAVFSETIGTIYPSNKKADIESLRESIEKLPPEETQFFSYRLSEPVSEEFSQFTADQGHVTVVFPPKLLYEMMKFSYGNNAVRPNPVLGFSLRDDFADENKRDVLIPCRYVTTPKYIHELDIQKNPLFAYIHDLIHCLIESADGDRSLWLELAATLEMHHLPEAANYMLDRAFLAYLKPAGRLKPIQTAVLDIFFAFENDQKALDIVFDFLCGSGHGVDLLIAMTKIKNKKWFSNVIDMLLKKGCYEEINQIFKLPHEQISRDVCRSIVVRGIDLGLTDEIIGCCDDIIGEEESEKTLDILERAAVQLVAEKRVEEAVKIAERLPMQVQPRVLTIIVKRLAIDDADLAAEIAKKIEKGTED